VRLRLSPKVSPKPAAAPNYLSARTQSRSAASVKRRLGDMSDEHRCIIDDDLASVIAKLKAADAAVFATPVYFFDLSDSLRGFLTASRITPRPVRARCRAAIQTFAGCIFSHATNRVRSRCWGLFSRRRRTRRAVLLRPVGKDAS